MFRKQGKSITVQNNTFSYILARQGGLPIARFLGAMPSIGDRVGALKALENQYDACKQQVLAFFDTQLVSENLQEPLRTKVYNFRKRLFQGKKVDFLTFLGDFLPEEQVSNLQSLQVAAADLYLCLSDFEGVWMDNLHQTTVLLTEIARDSEDFRRGLLFASHDLLRGVRKSSLEDLSSKKRSQLAHSLLHYLSRASLKTSPLSRFTTTQFVNQHRDSFEVDEIDFPVFDHFTYTPNVTLLDLLYATLWQDAAYYRKQKLKLNGCVTTAEAEKWSFFFFDGKQEACQTVQANPVLEALVSTFLAHGRSMSFTAVCDFLSEQVEADAAAVEVYTIQLIDVGLLQWVLPDPGLDAKWCQRLLNHLAYYPDSEVAMAGMHFLYGVHQSGKAMSYMAEDAVIATQERVVGQVEEYCKLQGIDALPISPEHIWYEDVSKVSPLPIATPALQALMAELTESVKQWQAVPISGVHATMLDFFKDKYGRDISVRVPFTEFAKDFLQENRLEEVSRKWQWGSQPIEYYRFGCLVQTFEADGTPKAVMNAAYGGGGKLYGRFLGSAPTDVSKLLLRWNTVYATQSDILLVQAGWSGYYNANFAPLLASHELDMHGSRGRNTNIPLGLMCVRLHAGGKALELVHADTLQVIQLLDISLEALENKPPGVQLLYHLGVPYCSVEVFREVVAVTQRNGQTIEVPRIASGNWVFRRQAWRFTQAQLGALIKLKDCDFFLEFGRIVKDLGAPERFFIKFRHEKPQYCDVCNALSVQSVEKSLRKWQENVREGGITIVEVLPDYASSASAHATELALECKIS